VYDRGGISTAAAALESGEYKQKSAKIASHSLRLSKIVTSNGGNKTKVEWPRRKTDEEAKAARF
jgi:hypothetical protein